VSGDAVHQPTWPLLLKIEHMVKLQVFGRFRPSLVSIGLVLSEEKIFEKVYDVRRTNDDGRQVMGIAHLTLWVRWGKNDQHIKIYLPCNFEVNLITQLGVIALFSSNL
jgi:hypothetical protein